MNKKLRILGFILSLLFVLGASFWGIRGLITKDKLTEVDDYHAYSEAVLEEAKAIPVQNDGRVKPFQSWAETYMLAMHGQRGMEILVDKKKVKITPTSWLLDVIFRPEQADKLPTFRVDNSNILAEFGMDTKGLRDRYSMNQLKPFLEQFDEENRSIREKVKKQGQDSLTLEEKQTTELFQAISIYLNLRNPFLVRTGPDSLVQQIGLKKISDVFGFKDKILGFAMQSAEAPPMQIINGLDTLANVFNTLAKQPQYFGEFSNLTLFPPSEKEDDTWISAGKEYAKIASHNEKAFQQYLRTRDALLEKEGPLNEQKAEVIFKDYFNIFTDYIRQNSLDYPEHVQEAVRQIEMLSEKLNTNEDKAQLSAIKEFKKKYANTISQRGEAKSLEKEIGYNDRNYFNNGLALIILALFIVIVRCMLLNTKTGRVLYWLAYGVAALATLYIITGITHRSIIMNRPPVGTLYDTMPFIVGASLLLLLLIELIGKKGIMLAIATVLGIGGIVLAKQYEVSQATDNLAPLRAVLKSNYWLTTHVITITLGYAGGLITAFISVFYILARTFGIINKPLRKHLTGIAYGMVAFTLVFSLVGTILGGIWGADSWGRFWGWDPKENGALMIVIWVLIILHARMGGYIKEMGLHCCGVFTAAIVVFSWWHVNFLGVGLHSYGFTSADAMGALWTFYGVIGALIVIGIIISIVEQEQKKMEKRAKEYEKQLANES